MLIVPIGKISDPLALTCFETWVGFIDYVNAALAANNTAIFIPLFRGFQ